MKLERIWVVAMVVGTVVLAGCRIDSSKQGDSDNVKIATPFGGMQVKTNEAAVADGLGLPVYPGAELEKKGKDNGAADVNMSFGDFKLRVKAVSYRSTDAPDKVSAFYRKALGRYGDVIECSSNRPVGTPTHTSEGLTCSDDTDNHVQVNAESGSSGKLEWKAGSKQHQHIVSVDADGGGTKFGLVALDLPGHISFGDNKDDAKQ